jgi:hypothetical protein
VIGLSNDNSFVSYQDKWIDLKKLSLLSAALSDLKIWFNDDIAEKLPGEN